MRYTVTKQRVQVVGYIWMPSHVLCAMQRDLTAYDLENIGDVKDRDSVESWISLNFGDFSSIQDFRADFHVGNAHVVHEWAKGESELAFQDAMFPAEE